jgi:antitoxin component of RelBE/YafQ-DinJ toxin-antitoxin module
VESILEEMGLTLSEYLRLSMKQLTQNPQITLKVKKRYFSPEQDQEIEASFDEIESKTDMLTLKTDDDIADFFTKNF